MKPVQSDSQGVTLGEPPAEDELRDAAEIIGVGACHLGEISPVQGGSAGFAHGVERDADREERTKH